MPSYTVDVSEELAARIAALPPAGQSELTRRVQGVVAASFSHVKAVNDAETDAETDEEGKAWWNALTPQEKENYQSKMQQSFADIDAGRTHPAEEVYARLRAKYVNLVSTKTL